MVNYGELCSSPNILNQSAIITIWVKVHNELATNIEHTLIKMTLPIAQISSCEDAKTPPVWLTKEQIFSHCASTTYYGRVWLGRIWFFTFLLFGTIKDRKLFSKENDFSFNGGKRFPFWEDRKLTSFLQLFWWYSQLKFMCKIRFQ